MTIFGISFDKEVMMTDMDIKRRGCLDTDLGRKNTIGRHRENSSDHRPRYETWIRSFSHELHHASTQIEDI